MPAMPPAPLRLAHFSDTHLGYEAYPALSASGNNQRGEDVVRAFVGVCADIEAADPALVIHSGDVADRPQIPIRYMLLVRQRFERLAAIRPDGTRRQLVVIGGNHELPRNRKEACFLELFKGLPGVHIVCTCYEQIRFDPARDNCAPELAGVVIHALPHDVLKTVDFEEVTPVPGAVNILTAHGVAGGSDLYVRSLGREFAIPTDVLGRGWDYGALGHWHKQGPVGLVNTGSGSDGELGRVWYAGSTENMSFRDLRDNGTRRGYLQVTVNPGEMPTVARVHLPIRSMFRLPVLAAEGLSPEQLTAELLGRVRAAAGEGALAGAVVGQIVTGVSRDTWSLVDVAGARSAAGAALHYEITVRYGTGAEGEAAEGRDPLADLGQVLEERALELLGAEDAPAALGMARGLLADALKDPGEDEKAAEDKAPDQADAAAPKAA